MAKSSAVATDMSAGPAGMAVAPATDGLLHGACVALAAGAHALILGIAVAAQLLDYRPPGAGGRDPEAVSVEVVLTPVVASVAEERVRDSGAPAQLAPAPGAAEAADAAPRPERTEEPPRETPGEPVKSAAKTEEETPRPKAAVTVLTVPGAKDEIAAAPEKANEPAAAETSPQTDKKAEEEKTKTAARAAESQPQKEKRLKPQKRARAGGSAAKAKRAVTASAAAAAAPGLVSNYAAQVRALIARSRPRGRNVNGTAVVAFGVAQSGGLSYARIARSSGSRDLDRAALRSVQQAAPFPPPPSGMTAQQLAFEIPFYFR